MTDPVIRKKKPRRRVDANAVSIAGLFIALAGGGGGLFTTLSTNKDIVAKLETLNFTMVEVKATLKATEERNARYETRLDKQDEAIEKLKEAIMELKAKNGNK
jgi:outer membrane murein-binding lipoprotein Lpp